MPLTRTVGALAGIALAAGGLAACTAPTAPTVLTVPTDAPTISEAADRIAPGGLILVEPGTYNEEVILDTPGVTVRGLDRNTVIIDGDGVRPQGVLVIADGIRVENLTVTDHVFNGVLVTGLHVGDDAQARGMDGYETLDPEQFPPVQRFSIRNVTATGNGLYGIYAFDAQRGVIADSYASGSADSGIYVGQCQDCNIVVSGNVAEANSVGLEIANASDSVTVVGNRFTGNRVGMTLLSNYREAFQPQRGNTVAGNLISDNVNPVSPAQADGAFGVGIGIGGGQQNRLVVNRIAGNTVGIAFASAEDIPAIENVADGNDLGGNLVPVWDGSSARAPGADNCFAANTGEPDGCGPFPAPSPQPAPAGVPFFDVPPPGPQPGLDGDLSTVPEPLPETPTVPALPTAPPAASLLADLARMP